MNLKMIWVGVILFVGMPLNAALFMRGDVWIAIALSLAHLPWLANNYPFNK